MADNEEKVVPKSGGNGNLILIIGVALIVISLALSAVSLITIMGISAKLNAPEEVDPENMDPSMISVLEIDTFAFTEGFTLIYEDADGKSANVVFDMGIGIHNVAEDVEDVKTTLADKQTIIRDGVETLLSNKQYTDFKSEEGKAAVKAEILAYLKTTLGTESIIDVYFNNLITTK